MPFLFALNLVVNALTTYGKLQKALGEKVMSRAQVFCWHKMFSEDRMNIEDEDRSGLPSTSRTDVNLTRVCELVRRKNVAADLLEQTEINPKLLSCVVTDDESEFFKYDPET
ncbi:hypothetical protein J6590_005357 [Homalodisca vitripennis]|nr:hypothetical protein J6590_005357 [Homalodisca vitripennis]